MNAFIRHLSGPAEFLLVVLVCFWWGILGSTRQLVGHLTGVAQPEQITNSLVLWVVIMQLLVLAFAWWVGHLRGWSLATFGTRLSWKEAGAGLLLCLVTTLAILSCVVLMNVIAPGARNPVQAGVRVSGLTLPFLVLFAVVNPLYEEVLETGYFVFAFQRFGMVPAVLASALFRTFLHSYKGLDAIVMILPMGLVFGLFYWRWRQLWPLVVAHVLFDLWSLFALARGSLNAG